MTDGNSLHLGLIGDNIARSLSPGLHRLAGVQSGIDVRYDRLIPNQMGLDFKQVFENCRHAGFQGINVTYPYKEQVAQLVRIDDPLMRGIGSVNTVIFKADGPHGFSTDYSGFMAAYRRIRDDRPTGRVLMIGAGGVGRAIAFGLAGLGTRELRLMDREPAKAEALAEDLQKVSPDMAISIWVDPSNATKGTSGLINCTPVGMVGYDGTPLPRAAMSGSQWAFDAVYTPPDTVFLKDAAAEGLSIISGWELFFYQGVHAWKLFSGHEADEAALRKNLAALETAEPVCLE